MATVVHRASSALHDHPSTSLVPQRRPREPSIEIIDVDELDETEYMPRPGAGPSASSQGPPSQRRRLSPDEVIILDSDDEEYDPSAFATNSGASQSSSSQVNSRDISPPAWNGRPTTYTFPRPEDPSIIPMRRNLPSFPSTSAPVIADPTVSDYERFLQNNILPATHASGSRTRRAAALSAADGLPAPSSSSHPLPDSRTSNRAPIRAGGGLITSSRAHAAERRVERERLAQLRASGQTGARFRVRRPPPLAEDMHFVGLFRHDSPDFFDPFETIGYNGLVRYGPGFVHPLATRKTDEPDYRPEYTHPQPAGLGFSYDFDPSSSQEQTAYSSNPAEQNQSIPISSQDNPIVLDDDGEIVQEPEPKPADTGIDASSSTSPVSLSLVCSKCLDPLLLGEGASAIALEMAAAGASAAQVESERKARKIWGLRCGHLIDGKCLEALAYPIGALDAQKQDVKGKGKGKSLFVDMGHPEGVQREEDGNGVHPDLLPPWLNPNPIRSRLRSASSRHGASTNTNTNDSTWSSSHSHDTSTPGTSPPPPQSLGASIARRYLPTPIADFLGGYGQSKPKHPPKPRLQQTYLWRCPVGRCGKFHTSVKMDGVWGQEQDKGEGAIPLFI
ncbi:hypothetical protein C8R42DRAFT_689323 [Lentinula raphanica]|nr:hypothetical protein C8R42DRAFT_689323 [Lentinula raphanica]